MKEDAKNEKIKILYVDVEQNNQNSFKATFRFDYNIFTAISPAIAFEYLENNPDIRVVLSDQRMPDKTGVQFFEELIGKYPDPTRVLITAYADIESVIDAVNRGHIFRYIKKPWTDDEIKSAIAEANKFYLTNTMLVAKNRELQLAYDELGKFAYSITHDVRGPMLSVVGALQLSKEIDDIAELKELLELMAESMSKLDEYIKKTHEYYKLKRGMLQFSKIDFQILLADIAALFKIASRNNNIRFTSAVAQEDIFYSDEVSIKMILNNLLSNAFNYQRKDEVDKFVHVDINVKDNNAIITIEDNGIGIHDNHINNIFTMFYRATSSETGSGLGLFNVKDALNKLKGNIEVKSTFGMGTKFTITIPDNSNGNK